MTPERLAVLIDKYLGNTASPEEEQELAAWYQAANEQEVQWPVADEKEAVALRERLLRNLQQAIHPPATRSIPFYRKTKWRAAAAILLLISASAWWWLNQSPSTQAIAVHKQQHAALIVPGGNKAILTLADGSTIVLDSAHNTRLARQGNTQIIKLGNGQLAYDHTTENKNADAAALYNTVSTPKGGQYEVILPDGSHVWLNAASALRFPAAFAGHERIVELTGEAYFEVAKNAAMPFRVKVVQQGRLGEGYSDAEITVLGTHFNVNAYSDEAEMKTTLLEGRVRITPVISAQPATQHAKLLAPGQQAQIDNNSSSIRVMHSVDTEESIAWKNGKFQFSQADIKTVMRQIARWYDVEVIYEGPVSAEKFEGEIPRNSSLSDVFKILELSAVHFKTKGRKVIVMP